MKKSIFKAILLITALVALSACAVEEESTFCHDCDDTHPATEPGSVAKKPTAPRSIVQSPASSVKKAP